MKKTIAALATTALMGFGLVTTAGPASADCPYSGCVATSSSVSTPDSVPVNKNIKITFKLDVAGNVKPTGKVIFVIKRANGGYFLKKSGYYNGGTLKTYTGKLAKKGKYSVKVKFVPNPNSTYAPSTDKDGFKVG